jgi:hypothetical protein
MSGSPRPASREDSIGKRAGTAPNGIEDPVDGIAEPDGKPGCGRRLRVDQAQPALEETLGVGLLAGQADLDTSSMASAQGSAAAL